MTADTEPPSDAVNVRELLDATTTMLQTRHPMMGVESLDAASGSDEHPIIDVHFFAVQVDRAEAEKHRAEFVALCDDWPPDPAYMPENRLAGGPSYIEMGAQIGTFMGQQDAMRLMALGEVLGAWDVITPRRLLGDQLPDADADQMAGGGMVMVSGYRLAHDRKGGVPDAR